MTVQQSGQAARATSSKRSQRMVAILDLVGEHGSVTLAQLATTLSISPATVRRDLAELSEQRLLVRTHGGAVAAAHPEIPVRLRDTRDQAAKQAIAAHVATLIPAGRTAVALSGGSTTTCVAEALAARADATIVTNSLPIASLIQTIPDLDVVMTGGTLRAESLELVGRLAEQTFTAMNVGTAVLGADGIDVSGGVTTHNETEARTNQAMASHAQRTIVVADATKLGRLAFAQVVPLAAVDLLVTDSRADAEQLDALRAAGLEVDVVDVGDRAGSAVPAV